LRNLQQFLHVEEQILPPETQNIAEKKEEMMPSTRTFLSAFYAQHNKKLYKLLDKDFGWNKET